MPKRAARTAAVPPNTAERILEVAEHLAQTRGFNGFSYADIAAALGMTKASLHYHFPGKADLGRRLVERYDEAFMTALARIDGSRSDAREKLRRYAMIYAEALRGHRLCLCGMLAAEYATLPAPMQAGVRQFFAASEAWLAGVLQDGRAAKTLRFGGSPAQTARLLVSALEGAMLVARTYDDDAVRFRAISDQLLADLCPVAAE